LGGCNVVDKLDPQSPTVPPPAPEGLNSALTRNIEALRAQRQAEQRASSLPDRIANLVTGFAGSLPFVYVHLAILGLWVAINLGAAPGVPRFDETFVILATAASVEAIFLSTFVLISQNRAAEMADRRDELDLQINLLTEHEVTRLIDITTQIAAHLGVSLSNGEELAELRRDVAPEAVLSSLNEEQRDRR
jgi:uncharacterized membrane protein